MGRRRTAGLWRRGEVWHIDKVVKGHGRLCESTGTDDLEEAEHYLAVRLEEIRQATRYGVRPVRIWREAAAKYLDGNQHKATIRNDATHLEQLDQYIGLMPIERVHMETLAPFIKHRQRQRRKTKSINLALEVVRRIVILASRVWRDEHGLTWLGTAPLIQMLLVNDARKPYPLDWEEQDSLFRELPGHLANAAMFKVNTGCRQAEVCGLRWEWELDIPGFDPVVFLIPGDVPLIEGRKTQVKNRRDRVVVCNDVAARVVDRLRGQHPTHVFSYAGRPLKIITATAWKRAWKAARLPVDGEYLQGAHCLKHTYGRRLRAAGVPKETRRVLLGHKPTGDVTDHYSVAELGELYEASNRVCSRSSRKSPALHMVKRKAIYTVS